MRRTPFVAVLLVALSVLAWALPASAQEIIGIVRNSAGEAAITREGRNLTASEGTKLFAGDTLSTGSDGSLGVILRDDSTLSLGPGSSFVIQQLLFSPAEEKFGLLVRLTRGTMAYLSGLIGKLSPESVRFETPTASIGVRGTRFAVKTGEPASR
ncbi:MAG: FecR family protein [Candidatus Deferrimicrobiaceae bacterium]